MLFVGGKTIFWGNFFFCHKTFFLLFCGPTNFSFWEKKIVLRKKNFSQKHFLLHFFFSKNIFFFFLNFWISWGDTFQFQIWCKFLGQFQWGDGVPNFFLGGGVSQRKHFWGVPVVSNFATRCPTVPGVGGPEF